MTTEDAITVSIMVHNTNNVLVLHSQTHAENLITVM